MKNFETSCAQGDVLFRKIDAIPTNATQQLPVNGELIITHSETGHHHVMVLEKGTDLPSVEMFSDKDNALLAWIKVNRPVALEHRREHDTHESILFSPGVYEIRRQREFSPEGWTRVQD